MRSQWLLILLLNFISAGVSVAQDSPPLFDKITAFPSHFTEQINKKTERLEAQLVRQTDKYLKKLAKKEAKLL